MTTCRSCHTRILFVRIETTGRLMPVDPHPDPDGNVYARHVPDIGHLGHVATKDEQLPDGWRIYMPHFATCPATAGSWSPPEPATVPAPEPTLFDNQLEGNTQ